MCKNGFAERGDRFLHKGGGLSANDIRVLAQAILVSEVRLNLGPEKLAGV